MFTKSFLLSLILFLPIIGFSQNELFYSEIDTTKTWKDYSKAEFDSIYLNLPFVENSKYQTHIRISYSYQIIDLYSKDNVSYSGFVTNFIIELKEVETEYGAENMRYRYVYDKVSLTDSISGFLVAGILNSGQIEFPTDTLIQGWKSRILHCKTLRYQFLLNSNYISQSYFCPWSQDSTIEFKSVILSNYEMISNLANLEKLDTDLSKKLPGGISYQQGHVVLYKLTDKEIESLDSDKPRRDYLKSIKDTIDSYLKVETEKQNIDWSSFSCNDQYFVTFNKKGRLKNIQISDEYKIKLKDGIGLHLEYKRKIRKCKRKIKKIFKSIDLGFLDLKYEVYRTASFYNDKIHIVDNMIY